MSVHEQFAEDLALYSLGCLEGVEKAALDKHLDECASCRRELEQLRGDAALLALSASGPRPPARSRTRLLDAIAKEPGTRKARPRPQWSAAFGWAAAVAMIVVVAVVWKQNTRLKSSVEQWAALSEQQRVELDRARRIADKLMAQDAKPISVLPVGLEKP